MSTYALDIVFDSNSTPNDPSLPIAASYAWAENDGTGWRGLGQRPANHGANLPDGSTLMLSFFDAAAAATQLQSINVTISAGEDARPNQPSSPFTPTSTPGPWSALTLGTGGVSAGCNIKGNGGTPVPNGLQIVTLGTGQTGDWELTITFDAVLSSGGTQSFKVDPEMSVGPRG